MLVARVVILAATEVALYLVASTDPIWLLTTIVIGLFAIVTVEARSPEHQTQIFAMSLNSAPVGSAAVAKRP